MQNDRIIKCDVKCCKHNCSGVRCNLKSITVTTGCGENCTCCKDYQE